MIKDNLLNAEAYYALSDRLVLGFEWLKHTNLESLADGRYEILGNDVYANVQTYLTKEDAPFEAHRNYIDIQYMISGKEKIGVTDYSNCTEKEAYNADRDLEFLNCNQKFDIQILETGNFLVFFPHDAHQPSLNFDSQAQVKKVVVKVLV